MQNMNKKDIINNWLTDESSCAIISPKSSETAELKTYARKLGLGFIELLAKWQDNGQNFYVRFLLIKNISKIQTKKIISELQISICIFKDQTGFKKIKLDSEENIVIINKNIDENLVKINKNIDINFLKKLISLINEAKINDKTFELYEVEPPRPSYFHDNEKCLKII